MIGAFPCVASGMSENIICAQNIEEFIWPTKAPLFTPVATRELSVTTDRNHTTIVIRSK